MQCIHCAYTSMHVKAGSCLEVEIRTLEILANNQRWQVSFWPCLLTWQTILPITYWQSWRRTHVSCNIASSATNGFAGPLKPSQLLHNNASSFDEVIEGLRLSLLDNCSPSSWNLSYIITAQRCQHNVMALISLCWAFDVIMVALWNRADHYIFALWFLSSIFFFFS